MLMNPIEGHLTQRSSLPLPAAALVLDVRGNSQDSVTERLRIEITDLAGEMKSRNMNHWRFLTDFLAFRVLTPLRAEDVKAIRSQQEPGSANQAAVPDAKGTTQPNQTVLMGPTGPAYAAPFGSRFQDDPGNLITEGTPFNIFQQRIEEIVQEIDRLRNNRIKAVNDLSKEGIPGSSIGDATVRVIFLTSSEDHESLLSASAYAAHLKSSIEKLERKGYQGMVSTTIVCLDNRSDSGPPAAIIQGLRWNKKWGHFDSLLISEKYTDRAAYMAGAMQTYLAELLLYVLLIVPPLRLNQPINTDLTPNRQIEARAGGTQPKGEWVTLPSHSYLVGLGSMEHSARWGRRWLNYSLVTHAAEMLQNRSPDDKEEVRSKSIAQAWLNGWRGHVEEAIPGSILVSIPPLQAIPDALNAARPVHGVFTNEGFTFNIHEVTIRNLEGYLSGLERTYNTSRERTQRPNKPQEPVQPQNASRTLQDAVDSIPLIQQHLRDWEEKDPTLRKGTPLVNTQLEAQRVLNNPSFFTGVTSAVLRARIQLRELGNVIADFQSTYQQATLDLATRRAELNQRGKTRIDDLKRHIDRIPFLGKVLHFDTFMPALTFFLVFFLSFLAILFGLAWVQHLIFERVANSSFLSFSDEAFNLANSLLAFVVWGAILLVILAILLAFRSSVMSENRSAWRKEVIFWLMLIVFAFVGLLFSFSLGEFANDPESLALVSWLSPLPYISSIVAVAALAMLLTEAIWFWRWLDYLMTQRAQIANDLRTQHEKNVGDVNQHISDTVALYILRRAGLTDGNGGPGSYYGRVDQLYKRLVEITSQAKIQADLAASRLVLSLSETQPGAPRTGGPWLNLDIREEWLDVESLTAGFQRLRNRLTNEADEFKEFSQLLLRMMGEETPIQIEQQFREQPSTEKLEQRQVEVLIATLTALVLRFAVAAPTVDSLTPIIERYDSLEDQQSRQIITLSILIDTLRKKVRDINLQPLLSAGNSATSPQIPPAELARENINMATGALAAWTQMLWEGEGKDNKLKQTLVEEGIVKKLEKDNQDSRAVLRRLYAHTMLFGRSDGAGNEGEGFLLISPSGESSNFLQSLNIPSHLRVDFADPERLLLFYIQRYAREALFIPEPDSTPSRLLISPDSLMLNATSGIVSQSITIGNPGDDALNWTAELESGAPPFLTLATPPTRNLAGKAEMTLQVNVNTAGLTSASTVTTSITLNAFEPRTGRAVMGSPIAIPVSVNIIPLTLQLSETTLLFTTAPGSNPPAQSIDVANASGNALTWEIEQPPQAWLTVDPLTRNCAPGETSAVTFSVDATNLFAGIYHATLAITPSSGAVSTVTIKLVVV